ncbi:hypothetical protein FXV83_08465 [Bradyrhizobium hipponense]|uniref:Uncharacterized protein n=1 Tax=Bradyrhizobium hipponense TaxID=2605638 RepID=A0A5S4YST4_9BRAD|nr:hypothetical protein [Bradyrhizobium hipponense]TYO66992.1 hypothetical protein FXV83_08465 [Bradyrhizobium hipponense]
MADFSDPQVLGAILGGGLAGAVLNQIANEGLRWLRKPTLRIRFSADAEGCIADTPTADSQTGKINGQQRYLRLRVENIGRTAAQRVSVCMTHVDYRSPSGPQERFAREVIELKFAMGSGTVKDIGARSHRFVDVFGVADAGGIHCVLGVEMMPLALATVLIGPGDYSLKVIATADNADSVEARISWRWSGTVDDLEITNLQVIG